LLGGISILPSTSIFSVTFDVTAENHNSHIFYPTIQSRDITIYIFQMKIILFWHVMTCSLTDINVSSSLNMEALCYIQKLVPSTKLHVSDSNPQYSSYENMMNYYLLHHLCLAFQF
jgi:hypothetical protein